MATILQTLETECANLTTPCTFKLANLEEGNATIFDKLTDSEFPLLLVLPFDINDVSRETGRVISEAEINALFLTKVSNSTMDDKAYDVEQKANAPMRALAKEFVNRLDLNDIIEDNGIETVNHRTVQGEPVGDAHLYGCWSVFTIRFSEDLSTCLPHE